MKELTHDEREGMPSASGLERIALCPGSWQAERRCPVTVASADAQMGTRLHRCMETMVKPSDPQEREAVEWCQGMETVLTMDFLDVDEAEVVEDVQVHREVRCWEKSRRFSGALDYLGMANGHALVVDYKFGRVAVTPVSHNLQLAAYALLVMDNYPEVNCVYCSVLQPFVSREKPQVCRFTREEEGRLRSYFYGLLDEAAKSDALLSPGERQCKYCRATACCPAVHAGLAKVCQTELRQSWEQLPLAKRVELYRTAQLAKRYVARVEAACKEDLRAGLALPGLELAPGAFKFTVENAQGAFGLLNKELGITAEEFAACCTVKISELDKLAHAKLKERIEGMTTKSSREWLRTALADFGSAKVSDGSIREKKGGLALV